MKAFKLYLSKLNETVDILWQRPKTKLHNLDGHWFDAAPIGRDPLNSTMKEISKSAKLSMIYTNHCIRASVVTNLNEMGYEARDIMATTGHKSEASIRSYAKKIPSKKRCAVSDSLASKIVDINKKKQKKEGQETVTSPHQNAADKRDVQDETLDSYEIFPDFEDADLVQVLTQIEKENEQVEVPKEENTNKNVAIQQQKSPKTINYSSMLTNISNVNRMPHLPQMYFPNSNVTINYNFAK